MRSLFFIIVLLCSISFYNSVRITTQQEISNSERFNKVFDVIESLLTQSETNIESIAKELQDNELLCSDLNGAYEASQAIKKGKIGRCDKLIDLDIQELEIKINGLKDLIEKLNAEVNKMQDIEEQCKQAGRDDCFNPFIEDKQAVVDQLTTEISNLENNITTLEEEKRNTNELYSKYLLISKYGDELISMKESICANSEIIKARLQKE